ncbi:DUF1800 family protein [bacterium]|nr:DUF1800 family protein [bacterium]
MISRLQALGLAASLGVMSPTASFAIDLNNNGISDVWEAAESGKPAPETVSQSPDSDGDGLSDWEEGWLGFDPNNPNSARSAKAGGDREQFRRLVTLSPESASRFLLQASLGPTDKEIAAVERMGFASWIDIQLGRKVSLTEPYIEYLTSRRDADIEEPPHKFAYHKIKSAGNNVGKLNTSTAWMRAALGGEDHMRQRTAWTLSQILVATANGVNILSDGMCNYYDTLITGAFGDYEDLLLNVTLHPMMGRYLSSLGNVKAVPALNRYPDENYAREIMQLFSIGLWELNPDGSMKIDAKGEPVPTYSNQDIQTLARVFTGLWLEGEKFGKINYSKFDRPMALHDDRHDQDEKIALNGLLQLPAGQSALKDIRQTVKALANHPTTAPYISTRMINHMVTSNPSREYVGRVVAVWNRTDGNLGTVVKAILLDPEARGPSYLVKSGAGRLKDPILRTMTLLRGFRAGKDLGKGPTDYPGLQWWSPSPLDQLSQEPMRSPTVFNFFEAVYQKPGEIAENDLRSPEFQILNDVTAATVPNYLWKGISDGFHQRGKRYPDPKLVCDLGPEEQLARDDLGALLDRCNLMVTAGTMRASTRSRLAAFLKKIEDPAERARMAVYGAAISPEGAILR